MLVNINSMPLCLSQVVGKAKIVALASYGKRGEKYSKI
jgi:hypothetical protein